MENKFRGLYTALITPFDAKGNIDWLAYEKIVETQISAGVDGLLFLGTTGESPTITKEETLEIFKFGKEKVRGRCKVIVGTGTNDTAKCIKRAEMAASIGADAHLVVNPYYNKPSQEGLYRHFTTIANATDTPVIVYNIKARTGVNIETQTLLRMAENPKIVGVKEASADIDQMMDVIRKVNPDFSVLVGDDTLALPFMAAGGDGLFSVISNCIPRTMTEFIHKCLNNNFIEARKDFYNLIDLMKLAFIDTNPIPIKEMMTGLGYCQAEYRLPLCRANTEAVRKINSMIDFMQELEK